MTIKDRVENILKASHKARNSDVELLLIYLQKSGMELSEKQMDVFRKMPSMETIRRTRQQLQEQGKYPASDEVEKERYIRSLAMRQNVKSQDPEKILEAQGYRILPYGQ